MVVTAGDGVPFYKSARAVEGAQPTKENVAQFEAEVSQAKKGPDHLVSRPGSPGSEPKAPDHLVSRDGGPNDEAEINELRAEAEELEGRIDAVGTSMPSVRDELNAELKDVNQELYETLAAKRDRLQENLPSGPGMSAMRQEIQAEIQGIDKELDALQDSLLTPLDLQDSLLTPQEERPPLPAAVAAEEAGQQYIISGGDSREIAVIVHPEDGGYYRHEYIWDEDNGSWIASAYEWGGLEGLRTPGRIDFIDPENSVRPSIEREDHRSAYERMQEHYDPEGNNYQYPNTLHGPGWNGDIAPSYDNFPQEPSFPGDIPDPLTDFFGLPSNTSPMTQAGVAYASADLASKGFSAATVFPAIGVMSAVSAGDYLSQQPAPTPTPEGPAPQNMDPNGRPLTYEERNMS